MKKILSAVLAVAFLFSVAPVFAAVEIGDGLTLSGVGNIIFQGGGRSFKKDDKLKIEKAAYEKGNEGFYVGALTVTKTFEDGAEAGITIKAGSGQASFGNNDAAKNNGSDVVIAGLWYQQPFLDNSLKVKVGRIGALGGANAVAGSADTQFSNAMFTGEATKIGPWDGDGADPYGVTVTYSPIELIDISYNYAAANGKFQVEDSVTTTNNDGKDMEVSGVIYEKTYSVDKEGYNAIEVNVKPFENGNYRVTYWTLAENVTYIDSSKPKADRKKEQVSPSGIFFSIDQEVIENVAVFARFGLVLEEKAIDSNASARWNLNGGRQAKQAWSLGGQVKGAFWSRDNDVVGVAVGQKTYTDIKGDDKTYSPSDLITELYYKFAVSETVSVLPTIQYIAYTDRISGDVENNKGIYADSEFAYALRVNYSF